MKLETLHAEWTEDQKFPVDEPAKILFEIPYLHQKYWKYYTDERATFQSLTRQYDTLRLNRFNWYVGRMDEETREALGWEPQPLRLVRSEVDAYVTADPVVQELRARLDLQENKLKFLEGVIKHIDQRNFMVKSLVDWLRFSGGAG